uniref:Uncharacterized protein n=1 Tax=Solanum tuberosum TaxID=4113 RepID=M1B6V4_SOLTU
MERVEIHIHFKQLDTSSDPLRRRSSWIGIRALEGLFWRCRRESSSRGGEISLGGKRGRNIVVWLFL